MTFLVQMEKIEAINHKDAVMQYIVKEMESGGVPEVIIVGPEFDFNSDGSPKEDNDIMLMLAKPLLDELIDADEGWKQ